MKFVVTQENLAKALQTVGRVASGKTPLPILNNILFTAESNRLRLAATNLEIAITAYVGGKIDDNGSITVPAKLTSEFISNLPKGNITIETDGAKLKIKSGTYQSVIHGMLPDEFPALPEIQADQEIILPSDMLKRAIQQTVLVASTDDTRPILTGIFCHSFEGNLYLAATDGYRLAERQLCPTNLDVAAIIPAQTLQEVLRIMHDDLSEVKIVLDENQVRFLMDDIEITSRLIDGVFVDYRQLIPTTCEVEATLKRDEFIRITKVASLFARENGGSVTIKVNEADQKLSIHSIASQLGENDSEVDAQVGATGQVALNSRYLIEALNCIDSPTIKFSFSGKISPCVLSAAADKSDYKHIVMPLKS